MRIQNALSNNAMQKALYISVYVPLYISVYVSLYISDNPKSISKYAYMATLKNFIKNYLYISLFKVF